MKQQEYETSIRKRVIITGGTKGIGRALVEKFAEEGFDLAICSRNEQELKDCKAAVQAANPGCEMLIKVTDVSKSDEVGLFAQYVLSHWPSFDVLINNAGVYIQGNILDAPEGSLEQMVDTNLYSAYWLTRALLPTLLQQKNGHVFNMCSIASDIVLPGSSTYCVSKFALLGFSKALREELKPHGIRVTTVKPGATWSNAWKGITVPEERLMKASDIAAAIWAGYILSDQAVLEELTLRPQLGDL